MNKKESNILWEMLVTIIVYGILLQVTGLIFLKDKMLYSSGLWIGIMLAVFMLVTMYRGLLTGLDEVPSGATKQVIKYSMMRYVTVVFVFGMVMVIPLGNPYSCFAGVLGLKIAAFLQPVIHRLIIKKKCKEVEI